MAKFIIKCPACDTVNTVKTGLLARKTSKCGHCGLEINIKDSRMISKRCPNCGDTFVYDQAKGKMTKCPSCGKQVDAFHAGNFITLNCPRCACAVEVDESETIHTCPVCDCRMDVQREIAKSKLVNSSTVSVIQYEGDNSTFVWKHPIENFNTGSQLIVHESQEAIFFMNGQALDLFGPGRYTLETENLPILKKIYNLPTGSQTPFHSEVYFINKSIGMGFKWGTDSRVRFIDPATGVPLDIGASGEMNLQVCDSRKLLVKLVGTTGGLTDKQLLCATADSSGSVHKSLQSFFRAPLMTEVKSYLASTIKNEQLDIMAIDEHMGVLSEALKARISPRFEEFGIAVTQFYVTYVMLPEEDPNFRKLREMRADAFIGVREEELAATKAEKAQRRKIIEAQTEAQLTAIKAQGDAEAIRAQGLAEAEVMQAKGYTQRDVLQADVQKAYAEGLSNMGSGAECGGHSAFSDMISTAAGMKMAGTMFEKMDFSGNTTAQPAAPVAPAGENSWTCECGEAGNTKKFCMNCGKPRPESWTCTCGHAGNHGKFCEECGAPRSMTWDCACGQKGNTGKCCPECGAKRPG